MKIKICFERYSQPRIDQCKIENIKRSSITRHKKLTLKDMSSAFVLLALGMSLAFLVFLIELNVNRLNLHRSSVKDVAKKSPNRPSIPPAAVPVNNKSKLITGKGKIEINVIKDSVSVSKEETKSAQIIATVVKSTSQLKVKLLKNKT